jgi:tetratricopeptide (TPR) repeat protein
MGRKASTPRAARATTILHESSQLGGGQAEESIVVPQVARFTGIYALVLVACSRTAPLPPRAAELNRAGIEALSAGDLESADARFALALEYSPRFVEALTNQALVELQRGNFARARQLLERARRLNPDVAQPHHGLGVLAERQHRPDVASDHYAEALRVDPGFAPARLNLGRLLFAAGMVEHARSQFKRLIEVAPEEPLAWAGYVESLLRLGRVGEAEAALKRALERFPDQPELAMLEARSSIRRGHYAQALTKLAPFARARDDNAVAALGWTAVAELARGRSQLAAAAAKRALELSPHDAVATYAMAMALERQGAAQARSWLERSGQPVPSTRAK